MIEKICFKKSENINMLIKKVDAQKKENSSDCIVLEYDLPTKAFSHATAQINGRYPSEGGMKNELCEQTYYVLSGSAVIHSYKGDFEIEQGDIYFFEKNEVYWVQAVQLHVCVVNAPGWAAEQYQKVIK